MKYPNKVIINHAGLFFGFVTENMPTKEFPFETIEVEITEENFNEIREILKQNGAPVLIEGVFVNKKSEIANFVISPNTTVIR
jgi:hypothetical protein